MTRRKRPAIRLRAQAVWDLLARMHRSQNWLADELGISRSHLSMMLNQYRAPSAELRPRLQEFLGVEEFDALFVIEYPASNE